MPQTLLGLLALAILAQLTFSQQQVTVRSYENQLRNEFSVAASGMMMEAMELLAARPYDASSSPGSIIGSGGLPAVSDFGSVGYGGGEENCDLFDVDLSECNDLDDFSRPDYWWPADVELSNGYSLPFEIEVQVDYVDGAAPDVPIGGPTSTKRVILAARTSLLPRDSTFISLERIIAYDAEKATADCIRHNNGVNDDDIIATCSTLR
ncbi:MAG: hypothetical protein AAGI91_00900 [Bacteroidota bacterium]